MKKIILVLIVMGFILSACTTVHKIKICKGPDCDTFEYEGKSSLSIIDSQKE